MMHVGRKGVLVLVVAAHFALLWLWSPHRPPAQTPTRRASLVVISLPPLPIAPAPESDKRVVSGSRAKKTSEAISARSTAASPAPSPARPMAAAAAAASEPASAPTALDLVLRPRDALRPSPLGAALNDARSNTPRLPAEERMAQTLGTDTRLREEIRPDGSVRIRQGTSCFDARQARATGLDPYNTAISPKPRLMSAC